VDYKTLKQAKKIYADGRNVVEFLKGKQEFKQNTSEFIEIAYDLQAGSYIADVTEHHERYERYSDELATLIQLHLREQASVLDIGTGELTTLTLILNKLRVPRLQVLAFDISWSRLFKGRQFLQRNCQREMSSLNLFVADINAIPLCSKSVDVITSVHALEPNGKNLPKLLSELFRVAKDKCILFEPCYELNSRKGQLRMDRHGYIKNVEGSVRQLGGKVLEFKLLKNILNPLNPTGYFLIEPSGDSSGKERTTPEFSIPGTDLPLSTEGMFLGSPETGLLFPVLEGIPLLRREYGILGTAFFDDMQSPSETIPVVVPKLE